VRTRSVVVSENPESVIGVRGGSTSEICRGVSVEVVSELVPDSRR
jgi:hypothetical protein